MQDDYWKNNTINSIALLETLNARAKSRDAKLTPEEREERDIEHKATRERQRINAKINQGLCPECDGKLLRGKKDKHNDYKRLWTCKSCNRKHSK